uniref:Uncharacterized protein n=1 Tax=Nelumbo nucifera TaxID=4432 RepID=A0A822XQS5_NELNU|nr:TPA_asm: hypothetical protein HUJ06_023486 [Nelumbo nucifera]
MRDANCRRLGGTGVFRISCGYCLAKTHSMAVSDAVIRYNATLIH